MSDVLVILARTCEAEQSTFGNICSECLERETFIHVLLSSWCTAAPTFLDLWAFRCAIGGYRWLVWPQFVTTPFQILQAACRPLRAVPARAVPAQQLQRLLFLLRHSHRGWTLTRLSRDRFVKVCGGLWCSVGWFMPIKLLVHVQEEERQRVSQSVSQSVGWLLVSWLAGWLVGWLAGWLVSWLVD